MTDKKTLPLDGVEETLLLPLWGRYSESKKAKGLLKDNKCIEIVEKSGVDFSAIAAQQHPLTRLAWIARAWNTDLELQKLCENEEAVTVLNLGCGLDTAFFRLNYTNIYWYDLDLPNVITLRRNLIGENEQCTMIAGSVLNSESYQDIHIKGKLVVLALGLLCYLTGSEVQQVLRNFAGLSACPVMVLDYFSEIGVDISNKMVLQKCSGTKMVWYANDEADLLSLHPGIRILENYPLFQKIQPLLTEKDAQMAAQSDQHRINSIAVIEIKKER